MPLDTDTFATRAGLSPDAIEKLSRLRLLPDVTQLEDDDIPVARLAVELERSGVSLDELALLVGDGALTLENVNRAFVRATGMQPGSLEGLAAELGVSAEFAESIGVALGVPAAGASGSMRVDDAAILRLLAELVGLGVSEPVVVDLFLVLAENLRKMTRATGEMWAAGVLQPLLDSGMTYRHIVAAESLNGERLQRIGVEVVSTAWSRFLDDEIFSGAVEMLEMALAEAGLERAPSAAPPAIAFLDLTAFTALTERSGDDAAAAHARDLRTAIAQALVTSGGTLVKMLGDGAMLHFADAVAGVRCALDLITTIPSLGLPRARLGISAGPVIVRDADYYGHTVNVAARLVDYARPSEVLVTADVVEAVDDAGVAFSEIGPVSLKGIVEPVPVFSASARPDAGDAT
jgi:adenylate cyclase